MIAALIERHQFHQRALPWLVKAQKGEIGFYICQHSLAELYLILTTLPVRPRIATETAKRLITENVKRAILVSLRPTDYRWCINQMSTKNQSGGAIYDALIARAALRSHVDRIITFDPDDFRKVLPEDKYDLILVPS